ncbi:MAG: Ig-like domain-containing protein [Spirochaetales bacterium]
MNRKANKSSVWFFLMQIRVTFLFGGLLAVGGVFMGCSLLDLSEGPPLKTYPAEENEIVASSRSLRVEFPFVVDRTSAETIVTVHDAAGTVPGTFTWEENTLYFRPEPELAPGFRYVLSIKGTVLDSKGISHLYNRTVPFFYKYKQERTLYIKEISPARGEVIYPTTPISLTFNRSVNPVSFKESLSFSPSTPTQFEWDATYTKLRLIPEPGWQDKTVYNLNLSNALTDEEGMPLGYTWSYSFLVQLDTNSPRVVSVEAALKDGETFPALGTDLNSLLKPTDALRITFSEPMEPQKTKNAVRLEPNLAGTWVWLSENVLVFLPNAFFEAGVTYSLSIGNTAEDTSGNRLYNYPTLYFTPAVSFLEVETHLLQDNYNLNASTMNTSVPLVLTLFPPNWSEYTFRFIFSGASFLTAEEKLKAQEALQITCLFPPFAPSPYPIGYSWVGGNQLSVTFTGFSPAGQSQEYYYLLTIKGGQGGLKTDTGIALKEDLKQLFITGRR